MQYHLFTEDCYNILRNHGILWYCHILYRSIYIALVSHYDDQPSLFHDLMFTISSQESKKHGNGLPCIYHGKSCSTILFRGNVTGYDNVLLPMHWSSRDNIVQVTFQFSIGHPNWALPTNVLWLNISFEIWHISYISRWNRDRTRCQEF